jgi:glucosyl-dolichyl phosphate glucuronosyltransferase
MFFPVIILRRNICTLGNVFNSQETFLGCCTLLLVDASVVIATYNRGPLLAKTLAALCGQTTAATLDWEIVVVDNNSNDRTREVVEVARQRTPAPMKYMFEARQGKTFAMNRGISVARGDVLAFTDDDCQPQATWLSDVLEALARWQADGVGGRILPDWSAPPPSWLASEPHLQMALAMQESTAGRAISSDQHGGFGIWGANMAFRRELFKLVGDFATDLGPKGPIPYRSEEPDFVTRVLRARRRVVFDPTPVVHHYVGPERMRKAYFRKHAYYLGVGAAAHAGVPATRHILGIPRYMPRLLANDLGTWLRASLRRDPEAFCQQLELFEHLGGATGYAKAALRDRRIGSLR